MNKIIGYVGVFIRLLFMVPLMVILFITLLVSGVFILLIDFINMITFYITGTKRDSVINMVKEELDIFINKIENGKK